MKFLRVSTIKRQPCTQHNAQDPDLFLHVYFSATGPSTEQVRQVQQKQQVFTELGAAQFDFQPPKDKGDTNSGLGSSSMIIHGNMFFYRLK